jgi:hypothetical protein
MADFILFQCLGPLLGGVVADARGFRTVFLASLAIWISAVVALMGVDDATSLVAVGLFVDDPRHRGR